MPEKPKGANDESSRQFVAKVFKALEAKGVPKTCPRCSKDMTGGLDKYVPIQLAKGKKDFAKVFGPKSIYPAVVIICQNCGLINLHATELLGISHDFSEGGQDE